MSDISSLEKPLNENKTLNLIDGNPKVSRVLKKITMFSFTSNILLLSGKHLSRLILNKLH